MQHERTERPPSRDGHPSASLQLEASPSDAPQHRYEGPLQDAAYSPPPLLRSEKLIGDSEALYDLIEAIGIAAQTDQNVLIQGETGAGKTLAARTIHAQSARRNHWLIVVNCAVLSPNQLPSLLLGSPEHSSKGGLDAATGGTVVFDHVDQLAPESQAHLAHLLETHSFTLPVDSDPSAFNVRLLFLTTAPLPTETFRDDLYYRLRQFPIQVPPLRDRADDIVALARHFLRHERHPPSSGPNDSLSRGAQSALRTHDWPGNIRELRNAMTQAAAVSETTTIEADDLPPAVQNATPDAAQEAPSSSNETSPASADSSPAFVSSTLRAPQCTAS